ncbi:MAG: HNH endonuclease [Planctomycetia bacterium]
MPSKPRTLAGILRSRRHAYAEYNRARSDPAVARVHGSGRWQAVRARVLRDEPVCRECARLGLTEPATQVDHLVPVGVAPERAFDRANLAPSCTACHARKSAAARRGRGGLRTLTHSSPRAGAWACRHFHGIGGQTRIGPGGPFCRL